MNNIDYLKSAIKLHKLLHKWQDDIDYISQGGMIYYAIDVDVIKMYADNRKNYEYARVFRSDREGDLRVLVWALSKYLFNRENVPMRPLLLICPHNMELKKIFYAIMRDAAKEKKDFEENKDAIKYIFQKYNETKNDDLLIEELNQNTLDLIKFLAEDNVGYNAQLLLISNLISKGAIIPISTYKEINSIDKEWIFPDLYDQLNLEDYEILREKKIKWIKLLKQNSPKVIHKSTKRYENNLYIDAEVMSRLEYINDNIEKDKKRLVLITGDVKIQGAAKKCDWNDKFYDYFIRDPKVFFAAPDFFVHSEIEGEKKKCVILKRKNELLKWIEVSLCGIIEKNGLKNTDYHGLLKNINDSEILYNEHVISKIWSEYIRSNVIYYGIIESDSIEKIKKLVESESDFDLIVEKINKKVTDVWYDFWKTSVKVGYWMIRDIDARLNQMNRITNDSFLALRGIPALQLTYPKAMGEIYKLCQSLAHRKVIESKEIFMQLEDEDSTDYTAFLVYALAFGTAARWDISCMLSEISLMLADKFIDTDSSNSTHEKITGNEAAYLYAWSLRHSSANKSELLKAKYYLIDARRRKYIASGDGEDIRYDCEDIGIDITYNMYKIFLNENGGLPNEICDINICRNKAKEIIKKIDFVNNNNNEITPQEKLKNLMVWRQVLTYYYLSDILIRFKLDGREDIEVDFPGKYILRFNETLNCEMYKMKSCLNYIVYLISEKLYGESGKNISRVENELIRIFNSKNIKNCIIMPYDKLLFEFLRHLHTDK